MTMRTVSKTCVFTRSFILTGLDGAQPPGAYSIETDEELLDGPSFPAWRRHATWIRLHPHPGTTLTATIDPAELDAALLEDRKLAEKRLEAPARQAHRVIKKSFLEDAARGNSLSGRWPRSMSQDHFRLDGE